jgi:hypothetical protein
MEYKATLDWTAKIITGFVTALFLGINGFNFWMIDRASAQWEDYVSIVFSIILMGFIYIFCYSFRPTKYIVDNEKITIKRPLKDLIIDLRNIQQVLLVSKESMKWTIRTFGNGGLFGYYGKFRNRAYGNMTWYATKRDNYLLIETDEHKKIILTPDDTSMEKEIKKLLTGDTAEKQLN